MLKINGKQPVKSGLELAEHNIASLCQIKDYVTSSQACLAWLKINKDATFYDLEKMAREKNLKLYFIASDVVDEKSKISLPNDVKESDLKYQCILSCADESTAKKQIKSYSEDYEENLEKLKSTGFLIPKDTSFDDLLDKTKDSEKLHHKIMHNQIEVDLVKVDADEELKLDLKFAKDKFNCEPEEMAIGKVAANEEKTLFNHVYAYTVPIEGKTGIVSQYGTIKSHNESESKTILINDQATWQL